ncbi:MAG: 4Fe-4S binding protein [Clostridiales Family XIII bacterium]|nr:4Fe-4S binding protein [Clostridiales Family XIII bacterium]
MARRVSARRVVQFAWAAIINCWLPGYVKGTVYTGDLKTICAPGLNCYACPGAVTSCPIGAVQAVVGSARYNVSYYLIGFFLLVGGMLGRFICGFLCPFGLVQELLHRIPFPRKIGSFRGDKQLRLLKYVVLVVFVILLPILFVNAAGGGLPWFCKWICPAGTLEGGIPLLSVSSLLREAAGLLFTWKIGVLVTVLFLSVVIQRPFCKYLCPLGAIYALLNRFALFRYCVDEGACTHCGKCGRECPMQVDPSDKPNHPECVRCGKCKKGCPTGAIAASFAGIAVSPKK